MSVLLLNYLEYKLFKAASINSSRSSGVVWKNKTNSYCHALKHWQYAYNIF